MTIALLLLIAGVVLSALFSGSETGFYRVNPLRLLLDALDGDTVSRSLLLLTNHPSIFVATVLVGNNVANYLASLAVVIGTQAVVPGDGRLAGVLASVLLAPLLFVYGELMPKNFFYEAPNRMLRRCGLVLLVFNVLLLPVTALLWVLGKAIEQLSGESPDRVQLALARKALQQVFEEGHEAGILRPAQRGLAQGLFAVANQPIGDFVVPAGRVAHVNLKMPAAEIRRIAHRNRQAELPVEETAAEASGKRRLLGYLRVVDLYLQSEDEPPQLRPLVEIPASESFIAVLMRLVDSGEALGRVVDSAGKTLGFVSTRMMSERLFRG